MRAVAILLVFVVACIEVAAVYAAQQYPSKPVRFIVTFAPGSGADVVARLLGQRLSDNLGQQVVIDNRAGAGGNVGTTLLAAAEPDGHTIGMCATALVLGPSLYRGLPYDPIKDFAPITIAVSLPFVLVVHPGVAAQNTRELIKLASDKPGELRYASIGAGTMQQIAAELFKVMARVDIVHVPYKSTGQYVTDLLSGRVSMMFSGMPPVLQHVKGGKLRALGVTTAHRASALPDVPTVAEAGLPDYEASVWFGILAPARTAQSRITRLNGELVRILGIPGMREQLRNQGAEAVGNSPSEFSQVMREDLRKYGRVIRDAHITIE